MKKFSNDTYTTIEDHLQELKDLGATINISSRKYVPHTSNISIEQLRHSQRQNGMSGIIEYFNRKGVKLKESEISIVDINVPIKTINFNGMGPDKFYTNIDDRTHISNELNSCVNRLRKEYKTIMVEESDSNMEIFIRLVLIKQEIKL